MLQKSWSIVRNVLMSGPPGAGKTLLARALPTIFPQMSIDEALGYVLAGWLNSLPARVYVMSFGERARGAYFRHISWVTGLLPLPPAIAELMPEAERTQLPEVDGMARQALQNLQRLSCELHH